MNIVNSIVLLLYMPFCELISLISKFLTKGKAKCILNFIRQIQEILMKIEKTAREFLSIILNTPATGQASLVNNFTGNSVLTLMFCFKTLCHFISKRQRPLQLLPNIFRCMSRIQGMYVARPG